MALMQLPRRGRTRVEFERFVDTCAGDLLRTGYLIVWDLEEAEDLVQETLLRVARRWPRVRRMDLPGGYARRILVNLAINDAKRRSRRRRELERPDGAPLEAHADRAAAGMFEAFDARAELLGALAVLPPRQRAVLVLRYFEDLQRRRPLRHSVARWGRSRAPPRAGSRDCAKRSTSQTARPRQPATNT